MMERIAIDIADGSRNMPDAIDLADKMIFLTETAFPAIFGIEIPGIGIPADIT